MPLWSSRGLRGSNLEEVINLTNEKYRDHNLALIQKVPTPITPVEIDESTRHITLAYFEKKSTVDYIGAVQGIPVCFDAKESKTDTFSLQNVHEHQMEFMRDFEVQKGVAFFLINFTNKNIFYYMRYREMAGFWERMEKGGRKSIAHTELHAEWFFKENGGVFVPYLPMIEKDLIERETDVDNQKKQV